MKTVLLNVVLSIVAVILFWEAVIFLRIATREQIWSPQPHSQHRP